MFCCTTSTQTVKIKVWSAQLECFYRKEAAGNVDWGRPLKVTHWLVFVYSKCFARWVVNSEEEMVLIKAQAKRGRCDVKVTTGTWDYLKGWMFYGCVLRSKRREKWMCAHPGFSFNAAWHHLMLKVASKRWCNRSSPQTHIKPQHNISLTVMTRGQLIGAIYPPWRTSLSVWSCMRDLKKRIAFLIKSGSASSRGVNLSFTLENDTFHLECSSRDIWVNEPWPQQPFTTQWRIFLAEKYCWHLSSDAASPVQSIWMSPHRYDCYWGPLKVSVDWTSWTFFGGNLQEIDESLTGYCCLRSTVWPWTEILQM